MRAKAMIKATKKAGGSTVAKNLRAQTKRLRPAYRAAWLALIGLHYPAAQRAGAVTWPLALCTALVEEL
jgi:hypothetical protein